MISTDVWNSFLIICLAVDDSVNRRAFISSSSSSCSFLLSTLPSLSSSSNNIISQNDSFTSSSKINPNNFDFGVVDDDDFSWKITLPLERSSGGTNSVRMTVDFKPVEIQKNGKRTRIIKPKRIYKTIIDTGSPYLVIPADFKEDEGSSDNNVDNDSYEPSYFSIPISEELDNNYDVEPWPGLNKWIDVKNDFVDYFTMLLLIFVEEESIIDKIPFDLEQSIYAPTKDVYGSQIGIIEWKRSSVNVRDSHLVPAQESNTGKGATNSIVIGVLDRALTMESGGPLLGLVKRSNSFSEKVQLRPTFLDQVRIKSQNDNQGEEQQKYVQREITSFQIDSPNKKITLIARNVNHQDESKNNNVCLAPCRNAENVIPLVDLRPLGDFVEHYAFIVDKLSLNHGVYELSSKTLSNGNMKNARPIMAVFDTGLTGCLFTQPLWDVLIEKFGILDPALLKSVEILKESKKSNNNRNEDMISIVQSDINKNPFFYLSG